MTNYNEALQTLEIHLTRGETTKALDLLEDGPIPHEWGMKNLTLICAYGYADLTQIFVDRVKELDLNPSNDTKMSCLMHATMGRAMRMEYMAPCNYPAVVRILLKAGAKPNWRSRSGRTALHIAALYGEHEIVSTLLEDERVSEQINTKDAHGSTPLFLVCTNSQVSKEEGNNNSVNLDTVK
ncbi:ankyrin repeat-containing domain protein, partial [Baffinella frigidus]